MVTATRTIDEVDTNVWEEAEAFARSQQTSIGALVSEALLRYLDDETDRETAKAARAEGGRIPYELGRRLLLAETDAEAVQVQAEIDAYQSAPSR